MKSFFKYSTTGLALFVFSNSSQAVSFTEITYTPSGNTSIVSRAFGISDDGSVVTGFGGEITGDLSQKKIEAFQWNGSSMGLFGTIPDFHNSTGRGVSSNGSVIVGGTQDLSNPQRAFRWTSGGVTDLGVLPTHTTNPSSLANDVSDNGSIVVGTSFNNTSPIVNEAFLWNGSMTGLGMLPGDTVSEAESVSADGTVVAGTSSDGTNQEAFRWVSSVMTGLGDLAGGSVNSSAHGISGDGNVVVGDSVSSNGVEAFRWTSAGGMQGLGDLTGGLFTSSANATSQDGSVIVGFGTTASGKEAFVWDTVNGMRNLKELLVAQSIDMTGWTLEEATSISCNGLKIAGFGTNPSGDVVGWIADLSGLGSSISYSNDFNADCNSDIFWRHDITNANKIYLMNGNVPVADQNVTISATSDPAWQVVGNSDFNKDGKTDLLWRNSTTGANHITLMNGTATPGDVPLTIADFTNTQWKIAGVGDFDGDGDDDIFWRNNSTGENRITFMDGTTVAVNTINVNVIGDLQWSVAGIADFNLDGRDDVLWRHDVNKRVWIYLMNGNTITNGGGSGEHVVFTAANWNIEGVGDFNADGRSDILWRNDDNGRVWMYYMNGKDVLNGDVSNGNNGPAPGEHVAFTSLVWNIRAVGDYNGDGKQDIFWRNDSTGENYMYLMDGVTLVPAGGLSVNTLSDLNWKVESK